MLKEDELLTIMNAFVCAVVKQSYDDRKVILSILDSAIDEIKGSMHSNDNSSLLETIDILADKLGKRTKITEIMYAMNGGSA